MDNEIHLLVKQISKIDDAEISIGRGPKHPTNPNSALQGIIAKYLNRYSFLKKDGGYTSFIESYAGMHVYRPVVEVGIDVFGFSDASSWIEITEEGEFLWLGESKIIEDGYLVFCDAKLVKEEKPVMDNPKEYITNMIATGFAYDATGRRKWGIYRAKNTLEYENIEMYWYCATFLEWLNALYNSKGNFPEHL